MDLGTEECIRKRWKMETFMMLVKDIGFPIFVAVFCLVRLDTRLIGIHDELKKMNSKGGEQKV